MRKEIMLFNPTYKVFLTTILLSLLCLMVNGQDMGNINGNVLDGKDKQPLPGATILLTNVTDSIQPEGTISGMDGTFSISVPKGKYEITVSFLGFNKYLDTLLVNKGSLALKDIVLYEEKSLLEEINVISSMAPTFQKGDTTFFNPDAFKVNLDATANDLLMKMPGFYRLEGKLMAMGDTIKEVLIDGKRFFGSDVGQALDMIPPKIIEKIEVYQYKSEASKRSGFEESTEGKTVNVVTNLDRKSFIRSELSAGIGKEERYAGNGYYNRFKEKNQLGIDAKKNNVQVPMKINRGSGQNSISGNEQNNNNIGGFYSIRGREQF